MRMSPADRPFVHGSPAVASRRQAGAPTVSAPLLATLVLLAPAPTRAHEVGASVGRYVLEGRMLEVELTFSSAEIARVRPRIEVQRQGRLDRRDLERVRAALASLLVDPLAVVVRTSSPARCTGEVLTAGPTESDGLTLHARFTCPVAGVPVSVRLGFLPRMTAGHRHVAEVRAGGVSFEEVLWGHADELQISPGPVDRGGDLLGFVELGMEHILTGFDHLLFLLGLILVAGRVRDLVGVVTAFTIAHSITLALAVLDVVSPSGRVVEPLIALSIAYVGAENWLLEDARRRRRWRLAFAFGLVHGFGFAGALAGLGLRGADLPLALLGFNSGVELGQIALLSAIFPLLVALRRWAPFRRHGVRALSTAIALVGLGWFVARVVSP